MPGPLATYVTAFVDGIDAELRSLSAGRGPADDHRKECGIEAADLVSSILAADGRLTAGELDAWLDDIGPMLQPPVSVGQQQLRDSDLITAKASWIDAPTTLFDLLVRADARDGGRRSSVYYELAMRLAHAAAAIDLVPSSDEIAGIDRFRTMLLRTMDSVAVARPGRVSAATSTSTSAPSAAPPAEVELPPRRAVDDILAELDALIGLDRVKTEVRRLTSLLRIGRLRADHDLPVIETSRHLVFVGNPGTGKTTVARLLSQLYRSLGVVTKGHLIETDRADLVAGFVGQTATKTQGVLVSALGGTLLIDEAYSLARGGENDFGREAIDTLVKFMEDHRDDLAVVVAGYPAEMHDLIETNPGLESRFARTLDFPDYTTDELIEIFELTSSGKQYHLTTDARQRLAEVVEAEPRGRGFGNARFTRNVFEQAISMQAVRLADVAEPTVEQLTSLEAADIEPV